MLLIKTKLKKSKIHGIGVFADEIVPKGTIIWRFQRGFDVRYTEKQVLKLPENAQKFLCIYAWKSDISGLYCLAMDHDRFMNHSNRPNVDLVTRSGELEVLSVAKRDIKKGEELLIDYHILESDHGVLTELSLKLEL